MGIQLTNYLLEQKAIDWRAAMSSWSWLLPESFTLWLVNRFADCFIALPDGSIHMLDVGCGTLEKVAEDRNDFCAKLDEGSNANDWLMIPLVDRMLSMGITLEPGQCYGFRKLPVLGGDYVVSNAAPLSVSDYLGCCGSLHEQMRHLPDGTDVVVMIKK